MIDFFNISRAPQRDNLAPPPPPDGRRSITPPSAGNSGTEPDKVGAFITVQSLATFPAASTAVTVVWKVLGAVIPGVAENKIVPLVVALVIGALIYLMSADKGQDAKAKLAGVVIAVINSFMLAAAALGLDNAAGTKS